MYQYFGCCDEATTIRIGRSVAFAHPFYRSLYGSFRRLGDKLLLVQGNISIVTVNTNELNNENCCYWIDRDFNTHTHTHTHVSLCIRTKAVEHESHLFKIPSNIFTALQHFDFGVRRVAFTRWDTKLNSFRLQESGVASFPSIAELRKWKRIVLISKYKNIRCDVPCGSWS